MAEINQIDFGDGVTRDLRDTSAIKWPQAEGSVRKNLLPSNMVDKEDKGITYRQMPDGTVKVWGTATANTGCVICQFYGWDGKKLIDDPAVGKSVILSGAPSNASASTFYLNYYHYNGTNSISDYGDETAPFTPSDDIASGPKHVQISILNGAYLGTEQNPTIFKPMIRLASITDSTYVPYISDNTELDVEDHDIKAAIGLPDEAGKNLLVNTGSTTTINNITYTVNADKTVTATAQQAASANAIFTVGAITNTDNKLNGMILSGTVAGQSGRIFLQKVSDPWTTYAASTNGEEAVISGMPDGVTANVYIQINSGATVPSGGIKFEPMIRPAGTSKKYTVHIDSLNERKLDVETLKTVTANAADFAAFKTAIANL